MNQVVPAFAENEVAGKPFALPTATWSPPLAATPFDRELGLDGARAWRRG